MGETLKAITLHRPWGYAIVHFGKDIENRTWRCPLPVCAYIAIHNGKRWDALGAKFIQNTTDTFDAQMNPLEDPPGAIIAIARFAGNVQTSESPWFSGPIGWKLEAITPVDPVYCRGQQGLWNVQGDEILACRTSFKSAKKLA
jgi:hypothetical protein